MATRAPSRSNSCAAASPIPLLPPVIRIFLFASLPIVVTPSSVSLRSDGDFSAIGEVRLWRNDDNVAVIQPLLYLNSSFCLLAADDANAVNDTFSDCPHRGCTFRNSDGTFGNCDTRLLRRRWLIFQEAHLGAHFRLDDLQIRPSDLDLDFDRALLAVGCGIHLHQSCIKLLVRIRV